MIKVKLRDTKRFFESEDADFMISAGEELELPTRVLRSYHIKNYLLNGHLKLVEGELIISVKHSKLLFSADHPDIAYGVEFGQFFKRDLDMWTIEWFHHTKENVPEDLKLKLLGEVEEPKVEEEVVEDEVEEPEEEVEEEVDFSKMTKDQINDFAAKAGYEKEIKAYKTKKSMIKKLNELLER